MHFKLPPLFIERMRSLLPKDEFTSFLASYEKDFKPSLRINTGKISIDNFKNLFPGQKLAPLPWNDNGFFIERKSPFSKTPYYHAGLFYIQEAASMLPVELMEIKPGEIILDACASPGSKTTQILSKTANQGLVIANEFRRDRVGRLLENVSRWGAGNCVITNQATSTFTNMNEFFDKILLDAPCSGEGMFKKDPEALKCWSLHNVQKCASTQKQLLKDLIPALKVGGTLIYSTCTFAPEENEETIDWLLHNYPDTFRLEPLEFGFPGFTNTSQKALHPDLIKTRRLFPHKNDSEGFFVAKLTKIKSLEHPLNGPGHPSNKTSVLPKASNTLLNAFFKEIKLEKDFGLAFSSSSYKIGYKYFYLPPDTYKLLLPYLSALKPVYLGVHLGDEKKNRLEPAQALALYLSPDHLAQESLFSLTLEEAINYLRGQEIFTDQKMTEGFKLTTFDGFPLGWGNFKQERLKNFFPKSLRNKL